jgi:hypothetical protein
MNVAERAALEHQNWIAYLTGVVRCTDSASVRRTGGAVSILSDLPFSGELSASRTAIPPTGQPGGRYQAVQPPSTATTWPVTYADASDASQVTTPRKSSSVPIRPSGVRAS